MQYFDHSTDAASDPKVMALRLEYGGAAVDAYWYIIEQLHRDEVPLCVSDASALRVYCHALCIDVETFEKLLNSMVSIGLLDFDEKCENISSERATENVERYKDKREKATSAAKNRWSNADANQTKKRTQSERTKNAMLTKQNKTKVITALASSNKPNALGDATAAKAASPNARPRCPLCNSKTWKNTQSGNYECPECFETFTPDKVVWQ